MTGAWKSRRMRRKPEYFQAKSNEKYVVLSII